MDNFCCECFLVAVSKSLFKSLLNRVQQYQFNELSDNYRDFDEMACIAMTGDLSSNAALSPMWEQAIADLRICHFYYYSDADDSFFLRVPFPGYPVMKITDRKLVAFLNMKVRQMNSGDESSSDTSSNRVMSYGRLFSSNTLSLYRDNCGHNSDEPILKFFGEFIRKYKDVRDKSNLKVFGDLERNPSRQCYGNSIQRMSEVLQRVDNEVEIRRKKSDQIKSEITRVRDEGLKEQQLLIDNRRFLLEAQASGLDSIEVNSRSQRVEDSQQRDLQFLERLVLLHDEKKITINEVKILLKSKDFLQKRIHSCLSAIAVSPKSQAANETSFQSPTAAHLIDSFHTSSNSSSVGYSGPPDLDSGKGHRNESIELETGSTSGRLRDGNDDDRGLKRAGDKRSYAEFQGKTPPLLPQKIALKSPHIESRRSSWGSVPVSARLESRRSSWRAAAPESAQTKAVQLDEESDDESAILEPKSSKKECRDNEPLTAAIVDDDIDADMSVAEAKSDFQNLRGKFTEPPPGVTFKKKGDLRQPKANHVRPEIIKKIIKKNKQKKMEIHLQAYGAFRQSESSTSRSAAARQSGLSAAAVAQNPYTARVNNFGAITVDLSKSTHENVKSEH